MTAAEAATCPSCGRLILPQVLEAALMVCPVCGYHHPIGASERIAQLADLGTWEGLDPGFEAWDPLGFVDVKPYSERLREARLDTGLQEAFVIGRCRIEGLPVCLGVMDFRFLGGSMGAAVGEAFRSLCQCAVEERLPLVVVAASGGARMQEGLIALLQMAKTVVALELVREAGVPYICVLTDPTTGGVLASFASLADVIIAEPGAKLWFTGPRVREMTIHEKTPDGFGTAEEALAYGHIDMVVPRTELRARLFDLLVLLQGGESVLGESISQRGKAGGRAGTLTGAIKRVGELARSLWHRIQRTD